MRSPTSAKAVHMLRTQLGKTADNSRVYPRVVFATAGLGTSQLFVRSLSVSCAPVLHMDFGSFVEVGREFCTLSTALITSTTKEIKTL
jgi:hypothetical protein